MTQLDQEDYHLFPYSLVYAEDLHIKLFQVPLISLKFFWIYRWQGYRAIVIGNLIIIFLMYWNNVTLYLVMWNSFKY